MKSFALITLLTFGLLFSPINSFAQRCNCDSLLNARIFQSMKRVKNSDSFKFINIRKKGAIKTISEKERISKLINADSAWTPLIDRRDSTINFFRLGSIAGQYIHYLDGIIIDSAKLESLTRDERFRLIKIYRSSQSDMLKYFKKGIDLTDEYFEVYFNIEGKVVMSPTICTKSKCDLGDNIISHFLYL